MTQSISENWYKYNFPLKEVKGAPVPSRADYDPQNIAPLIEFFAGQIGADKANVVFRYENNTVNNKTDDIWVPHPNDGEYLPPYLNDHKGKSSELERYEVAAKKSVRLKLFQDNSPANIKYFQKFGGAPHVT